MLIRIIFIIIVVGALLAIIILVIINRNIQRDLHSAQLKIRELEDRNMILNNKLVVVSNELGIKSDKLRIYTYKNIEQHKIVLQLLFLKATYLEYYISKIANLNKEVDSLQQSINQNSLLQNQNTQTSEDTVLNLKTILLQTIQKNIYLNELNNKMRENYVNTKILKESYGDRNLGITSKYYFLKQNSKDQIVYLLSSISQANNENLALRENMKNMKAHNLRQIMSLKSIVQVFADQNPVKYSRYLSNTESLQASNKIKSSKIIYQQQEILISSQRLSDTQKSIALNNYFHTQRITEESEQKKFVLNELANIKLRYREHIISQGNLILEKINEFMSFKYKSNECIKDLLNIIIYLRSESISRNNILTGIIRFNNNIKEDYGLRNKLEENIHQSQNSHLYTLMQDLTDRTTFLISIISNLNNMNKFLQQHLQNIKIFYLTEKINSKSLIQLIIDQNIIEYDKSLSNKNIFQISIYNKAQELVDQNTMRAITYQRFIHRQKPIHENNYFQTQIIIEEYEQKRNILNELSNLKSKYQDHLEFLADQSLSKINELKFIQYQSIEFTKTLMNSILSLRSEIGTIRHIFNYNIRFNNNIKEDYGLRNKLEENIHQSQNSHLYTLMQDLTDRTTFLISIISNLNNMNKFLQQHLQNIKIFYLTEKINSKSLIQLIIDQNIIEYDKSLSNKNIFQISIYNKAQELVDQNTMRAITYQRFIHRQKPIHENNYFQTQIIIEEYEQKRNILNELSNLKSKYQDHLEFLADQSLSKINELKFIQYQSIEFTKTLMNSILSLRSEIGTIRHIFNYNIRFNNNIKEDYGLRNKLEENIHQSQNSHLYTLMQDLTDRTTFLISIISNLNNMNKFLQQHLQNIKIFYLTEKINSKSLIQLIIDQNIIEYDKSLSNKNIFQISIYNKAQELVDQNTMRAITYQRFIHRQKPIHENNYFQTQIIIEEYEQKRNILNELSNLKSKYQDHLEFLADQSLSKINELKFIQYQSIEFTKTLMNSILSLRSEIGTIRHIFNYNTRMNNKFYEHNRNKHKLLKYVYQDNDTMIQRCVYQNTNYKYRITFLISIISTEKTKNLVLYTNMENIKKSYSSHTINGKSMIQGIINQNQIYHIKSNTNINLLQDSNKYKGSKLVAQNIGVIIRNQRFNERFNSIVENNYFLSHLILDEFENIKGILVELASIKIRYREITQLLGDHILFRTHELISIGYKTTQIISNLGDLIFSLRSEKISNNHTIYKNSHENNNLTSLSTKITELAAQNELQHINHEVFTSNSNSLITQYKLKLDEVVKNYFELLIDYREKDFEHNLSHINCNSKISILEREIQELMNTISEFKLNTKTTCLIMQRKIDNLLTLTNRLQLKNREYISYSTISSITTFSKVYNILQNNQLMHTNSLNYHLLTENKLSQMNNKLGIITSEYNNLHKITNNRIILRDSHQLQKLYHINDINSDLLDTIKGMRITITNTMNTMDNKNTACIANLNSLRTQHDFTTVAYLKTNNENIGKITLCENALYSLQIKYKELNSYSSLSRATKTKKIYQLTHNNKKIYITKFNFHILMEDKLIQLNNKLLGVNIDYDQFRLNSYNNIQYKLRESNSVQLQKMTYTNNMISSQISTTNSMYVTFTKIIDSLKYKNALCQNNIDLFKSTHMNIYLPQIYNKNGNIEAKTSICEKNMYDINHRNRVKNMNLEKNIIVVKDKNIKLSTEYEEKERLLLRSVESQNINLYMISDKMSYMQSKHINLGLTVYSVYTKGIGRWSFDNTANSWTQKGIFWGDGVSTNQRGDSTHKTLALGANSGDLFFYDLRDFQRETVTGFSSVNVIDCKYSENEDLFCIDTNGDLLKYSSAGIKSTLCNIGDSGNSLLILSSGASVNIAIGSNTGYIFTYDGTPTILNFYTGSVDPIKQMAEIVSDVILVAQTSRIYIWDITRPNSVLENINLYYCVVSLPFGYSYNYAVGGEIIDSSGGIVILGIVDAGTGAASVQFTTNSIGGAGCLINAMKVINGKLFAGGSCDVICTIDYKILNPLPLCWNKLTALDIVDFVPVIYQQIYIQL